MKLQKELRISLSTVEYALFCDAFCHSGANSKSDYLRRLIREYQPKKLQPCNFSLLNNQCRTIKEETERLYLSVAESDTDINDILLRCLELKLDSAILYQKILDNISTTRIEGR